jgi:poly(A) polymerase
MTDDTQAERIAVQPWMTEDSTRAVLGALGPGMARFAGGAVRDAFLGRSIADIDIATPLVPDEATRRLEASGIKVVPTGLSHGTVTAVVPPRHFEITTLRRDVETYGRHARVAFTARWDEDAARRDFTMNALFLDGEGRVFDHVGGLADLRAGHVRFVGEPRQRIREDVLRLLRFYRFYAHYGRGAADPGARAAARELRDLLPRLSAERVAAEMKRLLAAPDPMPAIALMVDDGVLAVALPEARDPGRLRGLVALEQTPDPLRRLAALAVTDEASAESVVRRLKLSAAERDRLAVIAAHLPAFDLGADDRAQRRALYRLGADLYADLVRLRAAETGDAARARSLLGVALATEPQRFPLKGRDVTARGLAPGPAVGALLQAIEAWWEEGDFRADRRACLAELARRLEARDG